MRPNLESSWFQGQGFLNELQLVLNPSSGKKKEHKDYSQGQKDVIQLKNSQELISPNMSSQFQLEHSPELITYFNWEMSTGRLSGNSPWVLFWGVPPFSGGEISTTKFLRINFRNMSSHTQLKIVLELILT